MATITSLSTLAKTSVGANDYLLVANGVTPANNKFLLQDLFPTVNTLGTSSEALFVSTTNKNTLNFKGIKSLNGLLTVATASNNITLQVNEASINLDNCDNSTAGFLSTVALASNVSGVLPIANGGTGLSTLSTSSFLYSNSSGAMTALPFGTNGQIVVGRTGLAPVLANLTAGTNVTITNGSGTITIAASLSTFTSSVNADSNNLYGFDWLSPDDSKSGIKLNSSGRAFVGSSTPNTFFTGDLNVNSSIYVNGNIAQVIGATMTSAAAPAALTIQGASAISNYVGGTLNIKAGSSQGSANAGGDVNYYPGNHDGTGKSGNHVFWGYNTSATAQAIMTIDGDDKFVGINNTAPSSPLDVKQESTTANIPVIKIQQLDTDESFINFVGTSGAASGSSISSSTASAASKTGAIRVKINGTDAWIRVYATAE